MWNFIRKLGEVFGSGKEPAAAVRLEDLQRAFRTKYHNFALLLTANGRAMAAITAMEAALHGEDLFGMSFVRAQTTAAMVNVFQMIRHLDAIHPQRYANLHGRFKDVQTRIEEALQQRRAVDGDAQSLPLVLALEQVGKEQADQVGVRMANLGRIRNELGMATPEGFVLTARAYELFMAHNELRVEINRRLQAAGAMNAEERVALCAELRALINAAELPPELAAALDESYARLAATAGQGVRVALRSSALGEDFSATFVSGLSRYQLNVAPDGLGAAYKRILAGKYEPQAMEARLERGIPDEDVVVCVGVTAMVQARSGGMACSRNPANLRDHTVQVLASHGLPGVGAEANVDPDQFAVSGPDVPAIVNRRLGRKEQALTCPPGADACELREVAPGDFCVADDEVLAVARLAWAVDAAFGAPVQMIWVLTPEGRLRIIQARPLMSVNPAGQCDAVELPEISGHALVCGGVTVSPGVGSGPVHVIRQDEDLEQVPDGAVLVGEAALAHWAPALRKASALVSEYGNPFGHLATVARSLQLPTMFRVEGAVAALRPGQLVTVDSEGLRVFEGRLDALLDAAVARRAARASSPIHEILARVLEVIAPLNLADPDAPTFRPRGCQTLHDIARFCHETAVQEMFSFGQDQAFAQHMARQLYTNVALQWWVINLADAFTDNGADGKFIRLEHIACPAMQAVWTGICAFPWAGSPPVNMRGLMSVMFESTINPDLLSTSSETFSTRNYFMVSRNYVSVSSRFGYHFTSIEALAGERPAENYICFRFKGGAAEAERKRLRLKFVGEILEGYGFRVDMAEEELVARLEGRETAYMEEKLRILGYLIIHTRQLDMIMKVPERVRYHRDKITGQIAAMLAGQAQGCPVPGASTPSDAQVAAPQTAGAS